MKKEKYGTMLPNVNYIIFEEDEDIFGSSLIDIEAEAMTNIFRFMEEFKVILIESDLLCTCACMLVHLSCYLGYLIVVGVGADQSKILKDEVVTLLKSQADYALKLYTRYPIDPGEKQRENFETLRQIAPSSIIAQTMRLWRMMFDSLDYCRDNDVGICPLDKFIPLLKKLIRADIKGWKRLNVPILYGINQTVVQIGWLVGCLAHTSRTSLDGCLPYLLLGLESYIENSENAIRWFHDKRV